MSRRDWSPVERHRARQLDAQQKRRREQRGKPDDAAGEAAADDRRIREQWAAAMGLKGGEPPTPGHR